jgi:hypothetical protein
MSGEISDLEKDAAGLRQARDKVVSDATQATEKRLAVLDERIGETLQRLKIELRRRDELVSNHAEWIEREARQSPKYVPMPQGLIDQLTALSALAADSTGIFFLIMGTKVLIMLLESAGPLAKFFFTTPGIYGLCVAMRVHDAFEAEAVWRRPGAVVGGQDRDDGGSDYRASPRQMVRRRPLKDKLGAEKPVFVE